MSKRLSTDEFIKKSTKVHGDKYDYSNVIYINSNTKVKIKCQKHGVFNQKPTSHLQGCGCPKCKGCNQSKKLQSNANVFVYKATIKHNNKYDYRKSVYVNAMTPLTIICNIHGEFTQSPNSHLSGKGCTSCGSITRSKKETKTTTEFIKEATHIHNKKYDYSKTNYINSKTKVKIICNTHNTFYQLPSNHLQGQGCPKCNKSKGESKISEILESSNIMYDEQKIFKDCKNIRHLPFDFYIPTQNTCIEFDGKQHFTPIKIFGGIKAFECRQHNDLIKTLYCKSKNINLIRISYNDISNIKDILKSNNIIP